MYIDFDNEKHYWYVLKAPYREQKMQSLLEELGYETYLPLEARVRRFVNKKAVTVMEPVINNVFLHTTWKEMQQVKARYNNEIQYVVRKEQGRFIPLTVPEDQMDLFVSVTTSNLEKVKYFRPGEINLKRGVKVRLLGGLLDNREVTYMKVRGSKSKHVIVVELPGFLSASVEVSADLVEVVEDFE